MSDWDIWLDKLIEEETDKVEESFLDSDPLMEFSAPKKKAGRPKGTIDSPKQKAARLLRKAKGHLLDSIKRLESFCG